MMNAIPPGVTRRIGKSQGYLGLAVADITLDGGSPAMLTAWHLTPYEITALTKGAPLYLWVLGAAHPPVMLTVGDPDPATEVRE
jgi:hypothetical protein